MGKIIDIAGEKFGKLTAIKISDRKKNNGGIYWDFMCDCGNMHTTCGSKAKKSKTIGCKACNDENSAAVFRTHGKSKNKSKAYLAWKRIKSRCFNESSKDYEVYSKLGMDEEYINDAVAFMEYVGEPPNDGKKYSIDRIDNSLGYIKGNMRWATDHQQAANQGRRSDNKTGVTGVRRNNLSYVTTWYDITTGKSRNKSFNVGKLGEELSFFMACECRELMIQRMNDLGAQYTPNHGL